MNTLKIRVKQIQKCDLGLKFMTQNLFENVDSINRFTEWIGVALAV
jgi:hypothetical protein